mmetsp:Transcript_34416/g.83256  ORF Transcript_34416/g.83256 Transcript_34416/m.83256 type:complete len:240 (+) Transcript_34416:448-1167(+)
MYHLARIHSIDNIATIRHIVRLITKPTIHKGSATMKQQCFLIVWPKGMLVHQRMDRSLPPSSHHPKLIVILLLASAERIVQFLERNEVRISALGHARKIHGLIHEGPFLKRPIEVPPASPHSRTPLVLVVRYAKDVGMRRFGMLVKRGLYRAQSVGDFDLSLAREILGAKKDGAMAYQISLHLGNKFGVVDQGCIVEVDAGSFYAEVRAQSMTSVEVTVRTIIWPCQGSTIGWIGFVVH